MWLIGLDLTLEKKPTIDYSGKVFKNHLKARMRMTKNFFVDGEVLSDLHHITLNNVEALYSSCRV